MPSKAKNRTIVEYALRDTGRPIGVAAYTTPSVLPAPLKDALPSVEILTAELDLEGSP